MASGPQAPTTTDTAGARRETGPRWLLWVTTPLILAAFIGGWKLYTIVFDIGELILPPPEDVWFALIELLGQPMIYQATYVTFYETMVGFLIAVVVGVTLGIVLGKVRWLERVLSPFLVATQVVPKVAIVPLLLLWFGFGCARWSPARTSARWSSSSGARSTGSSPSSAPRPRSGSAASS